MTRRRFSVVLALLAAGCARKPDGPLERYPLKGEIVRLDARSKVATIKHEKIEGFMEAMTMDFPVKDDAGFAKLQLGVKLTASLVRRPSDYEYWIENIQVAP
jgi:Cu/Ag efflux protein CusF